MCLLQLGDQVHLDTLKLLNLGFLDISLCVLIVDAANVRLSNIVLALRLIVVESRFGLHGCVLDSLLIVTIFINNCLLEVSLLVLTSHPLSLRIISILVSLLLKVCLDLGAVISLVAGCIVVLLRHETFVCCLELV